MAVFPRSIGQPKNFWQVRMPNVEIMTGRNFQDVKTEEPWEDDVVGIKLTNAAKPCARCNPVGAIFSKLSKTRKASQALLIPTSVFWEQ